jgi:hypothetical protein
MGARRIVWFSCGAASAVAAMLTLKTDPHAILAYCDPGAEDYDSIRFRLDIEKWLGKSVTILKGQFQDTWDVWEKKRFLSGVSGAPCTRELKVKPRLAFQRPDDIHVFGYTADKSDVDRAVRFSGQFQDMDIETPLIDSGLTKQGCLAIVQNAGINVPRLYKLGFHNNNCIPCVKATSPSYWSLIRKEFPAEFARMATLSRKLNVKLSRISGRRVFIDEIPLNHPVTDPIVSSCDFLCSATIKKLGE